MAVRPLTVCLAAIAISACGGEADPAGQENGAPSAPEPLAEPCYFQQPFPWYAVGSGVATALDYGDLPPEPQRGDGQGAHHLFGVGAIGPVKVTTHMHRMRFDELGDGLAFWARSELGPFELLFALTDILPSESSYETDLAAGRPWPMQRVTITDAWQSFTFMFDDLQTEAQGEPRVPNELGSEFQLLLAASAEYDLWLDDDVFVCANTGCAFNCQP